MAESAPDTPSPSLSSLEQLLADALRLLELQRPAEAASAARRAVADAPADARGWLLLSLALSASGEGRPALEAVNRAVSLDPHDGRLHLRASECLSVLHLAEPAQRAATEAVRLDPSSAGAHARLAITIAVRRRRQVVFGYQLRGGLGEASRHADLAVGLAPGSATAQFAAGYVAAAGGRVRLARRHYQQALAIDPTMPAAQNNLAELQLNRGRFRDGGAGFLGAARSDPRFDLARRNVERTVYAKLVVQHVLAAVSFVGFAVAAAGAASADNHAYRFHPGARAVVGGLVLLGGASGAGWSWRRQAAPVRLVARRMVATRAWLWLVGFLDLVVVGCFVAGAAGSGEPVVGAYGAGLIAMPVIALGLVASRGQAR